MRFLEFKSDRRLIIGVIHLPPLPGSPRFEGDFDAIVEFAVKNARMLEEVGFDGVIIENFNDNPFKPRVREPEAIASMAIVTREVVREVSIPVGVNLLRNSGPEATAIALAAGASFIRSNAYCEVVVSPEGILEPVAREVQEVMAKFKRRVQVLADIFVKHASPLHSIQIEDLARDCIERCLADALIVTGSRTGEAPDPEFARRVFKASKAPVLIGSGITPDNVRLYKDANGFIVGSYMKGVGGWINPEKARRLVSAIRQF